VLVAANEASVLPEEPADPREIEAGLLESRRRFW
jgi:hypothetical protein